jgi:MFS family permease
MLFCGIIVIMNQFKVPVFMPVLAFEYFDGDMGATGWLMSIIAVAGIITAFPAAFLINRFGPKPIGLVGIAFMVVGCAVGAATGTWVGQLLIGRVLEGVGVAMMGTVATTLISMYFPREKAGLPMGIWNLWYVTGAALAYNIGVPVSMALTGDPHSWHAWWWCADVLALVAFIVFALFVQKPRTGRDKALREAQRAGKAVGRRPSIVEGLKVWRMWVFGLGFCLLLGTSLCVFTWVPTYVQEKEVALLLAQGLNLAEANEQAGITGGLMSSLGFVAAIPVSIITGLLLRHFSSIRARKIMCIMAGCIAFLYAGAFLIPYEYLPAYLILLGLESGYTSGVVWAMVPMTMPKKITMPIGMAIIIFFQGVSNLLCTPVVGYVVGNLASPAWQNVSPLLVGTVIAGLICWIIYGISKPPIYEEDEMPEQVAAKLSAK